MFSTGAVTRAPECGVRVMSDPVTSSGIVGAVCVFGSMAKSVRSQVCEGQQ